MSDDRDRYFTPAGTVLSMAQFVRLYSCSFCGAVVADARDDEVDRLAQHLDWHREMG